MEYKNSNDDVDVEAPMSSWIFTVISASVLMVVLFLSFLRYRWKRRMIRIKEEEYIANLETVLPGYSYRALKKSYARKIMTNTHADNIADLCMVPVFPSQFNTNQGPFTTRNDTEENTKLTEENTKLTEENTKLTAEVTVHLAKHRNAEGTDANGLFQDNSNDTTDEENKPLVDNKRISSQQRNVNFNNVGEFVNTLKRNDIDTSSAIKTDPRNLQKSKKHGLKKLLRKQLKPDIKRKNTNQELSMRSNFKSISLDFDDKTQQNYIVYSPDFEQKRWQSAPNQYHEEIEMFSNENTGASANNYYIEAGITPPEVKVKPPKGKRGAVKHEKHSSKKSRKAKQFEENRARSLPQLDNVYYANVEDSRMHKRSKDGSHSETPQVLHPQHFDIRQNSERIFIKRKSNVTDKAEPHSTGSFPLVKMYSLPEVSLSRNSNDSINEVTDFTSDYVLGNPAERM